MPYSIQGGTQEREQEVLKKEPVCVCAALSGGLTPVKMPPQEAPETPQLQQRPKPASNPEVKGHKKFGRQ